MRRAKLSLLAFAAAASLSHSPFVLAQGAPISGTASLSVSASPASAGVGAGVAVSVLVDLSSVSGRAPSGASTPAVLGGYQIGVSFDRTRLRFDTAAGGSSAGYTSAPTATNPAAANSSGNLTIVASQTSSTSPTGVVTVAVLSFTTLAPGTAALTATPTNLVTAFQPGPPGVGPTSIPGNGSVLNVNVLGPTVTPPPPTPTPTPPSPTPSPTAPGPPPTPTPVPSSTPVSTPIPPPPTVPPSPPPAPTPAPAPAPIVPAQRTVTIPVASHVTGAGGLVFLSDLEIENPGPRFASATLSFTPAGGQPTRVSLLLAPLETRSFPDVVGIVFGVFDGVGALRLDSSEPLRMNSRNYQRSRNGSFGQAVPSFPQNEPSPPSRLVTGLARTDEFRTNLGAVNNSDSPQAFRISLWSSDGTLLGSTSVLQLLPGAQMQWSLAALFPQASGKGMTAEFQAVDSSHAPFAYATVADNLSGDPTYYPSSQPAMSLTLPIASRVTGVSGKRFLSDVSMANVSDVPVVVTVRFLEHDRDNTASERVRTLVVDARQTRQLDDAIGSLFGLDETYGALEFESSVPDSLLLSERIYTDSSTTSGTVGQQVDPLFGGGFFASGSILGLQQNADFRSNLGFFNSQPSPVQVTVTLRRDSGSSVATATLSLPPRSYVQRNMALLFPTAALQSSASWTVAVDSSAEIFACAVVVDNVSEDPTYSPGLK